MAMEPVLANRHDINDTIYMNRTVIRLRRETSESLYSKNNSGLVGYLMKIFVENYHNIDPNIFVMQRDVGGQYSQEILDVFYSIASVGELEFLPINQPSELYTNFYRTNQIELMFETQQELEGAWGSISSEVRALVEANDISINTSLDVVASYPNDAFLRYYGHSAVVTPTEQMIKGLNSDSIYSLSYSINQLTQIIETPQLTQEEYYYFASTDLNVVPKIIVDDVVQSLQNFSISITNKYGLSIPYKIFRTQNKLTTGLHTVNISRA